MKQESPLEKIVRLAAPREDTLSLVWSDEAREAAAEARRGSGGGESETKDASPQIQSHASSIMNGRASSERTFEHNGEPVTVKPLGRGGAVQTFRGDRLYASASPTSSTRGYSGQRWTVVSKYGTREGLTQSDAVRHLTP